MVEVGDLIFILKISRQTLQSVEHERKDKEQLNDIDLEKEEAEDNDLDLWFFIYLNEMVV